MRYKVIENVPFTANGPFDIPVTAGFEGGGYNAGEGVPLRITRFINGIESVHAGGNRILSPGREVEEGGGYRERVKTRWRGQTLGDTKDACKYFAGQVSGARPAKIIRAPRGTGSAGVAAASVAGAPDAALLAAAGQNLHAHSLMAFDVQAKPPDILPADHPIPRTGAGVSINERAGALPSALAQIESAAENL